MINFLYLGLVFLAVASGVYGLTNLVLRPRVLQERLKAGGEGLNPVAQVPHWQERVVQLAGPLAKLVLPAEGWETSSLRVRFMNAGYRHANAPIIYFAAKVVMAIVLPLLVLFYVGVFRSGPPPDSVLMTVLLLWVAGFGFFLPNIFLGWKIKHRQLELFETFPDAIDLMVVCVEAGLGMDAAIARTSEEMRLRSQSLADELHLVMLELRVGGTRESALRNLALRTGLEDVTSLVTLLIQSDRFGTNVAEALRVHADGLRNRRHMRAEEAANKVPVKLVFPLVLCIFPALMLVLAGPPAITVYRVLFPIFSR